ncbi:MAG TPA: hypothetical protein VK152_13190 [Paludibacter sp.]|nr:hypothetical protein [Paludibacter sp.]
MEKQFKQRWMRMACLTLVVSSMVTVANAQRLSTATTDFAKSANAAPGVLNGSVRVIDNKGTVKYLQTANGLTTITNTTADVTTTTWQLGGTLTDNTYIDINGKVFGLDKLDLVDIATSQASTDATDKSVHGTGTGWTLLVRDEATGDIKKLKAEDLMISGQEAFTATAGQTDYDLTGSPVLPAYSKVWVYRNGVKLVANLDYTVAASTVTLVPNSTAPNDWAVYAGDVIEVQYVK